MIRNFVLSFFALNVLVSCASHGSYSSGPYQPATPPEKKEYARDRLDVYPDDIRQHPAAYAGMAVAWVGVIRSTDAHEEDIGDMIMADTVLEHHYFDWVQNGGKGCQLAVSPRGEGLFRVRWHLHKTSPDATGENAEKYAGPGKLAIVYGVPESVDTNGTVVLKYRYIRIVDAKHFCTNKFDYGRMGETFSVIPAPGKTNAPPPTKAPVQAKAPPQTIAPPQTNAPAAPPETNAPPQTNEPPQTNAPAAPPPR